MTVRAVATLFVLLLVRCANTAIEEFIDVARANRSRELGVLLAEGQRIAGDAVTLHEGEFPDGHRQWLVFRSYRPIERLVRARLGPVTGRGFGDEDGWLLPHGALILQENAGATELIYVPGPAQDALEDLARPQLPSSAGDGELMYSPSSSRPVGIRYAADATSTRCTAQGNLFVVEQPGSKTVWRRPFAMWNLDIQQTCAQASGTTSSALTFFFASEVT